MEKVKFWKNTSSEFAKITSKDANTIYYLTDTGKIYLGEKMYGGTDMPFTIVNKDDKRFSSFDTLFLKGENDGEFKLSVDPGVYCLADDMEFAFSAFIHLEDYLKFMYQGQSTDLGDLVYKSTQCTLPKGSFIYITENMLEIYCTHTDVDTYGPGGGSGESFTHCEAFIIGTFPVALDDNEHVCGLIEFDSIEKDMEDGMLTYPFEYAMMNTERFKEGDTLVVTNNSDDSDSPGSWSGPKFKIGSAGVQATQITDVNYTNYQTMDQWSALNDGMYLVNTDKLSINVVGKNKVYSVGSAGFCALLGIEENYNKSLSIPKGNYISVYTTEAGGSSYYKYKMMVIYQIEANPDAEENNRRSAGQAVVITLGSTYMSNPFSKDVKVYDFNESLMLQSTLNNYISLIFTPLSSPDTVPKDGQLAQWEGDADHGFKLKGVDAPKGVPITTINTTNKSEFTTLKGILNHPDGMYLVDDCGVTNGDAQLTIAPFKGHCSTMLMQSIAGFQEVVDANEIKCYKGSTIYILTQGNISDGATRYISICNVPAMASGSGDPDDINRTLSDTGTSTINIEIHAVSSSNNGETTYSYDIDGGTKTLFTYPMYASYSLSICTSFLMNSISGDSSPSPGDLVSVVEDETVPYVNKKLIGLRASEFLPFTVIHNRNATNYNTLDKLCHLNDGLYVCNAGAYLNNNNYIFEIEFKGINLTNAVTASFTGTEPTPDTNGNTKCKNGTIISVATKTQHFDTKSKIIRITQGLNADLSSSGNGFDDIYIIAEPDDSSASTLVYGVTGTNVKYYRPFSVNAIYGNILPFAAMNQTLSDGTNANGKMAVWNKPKGAEMPTLGFADIPNSSPIIEINDSNWNKFDTLQKWMNASAGTYLVKTTKLTVNAAGIDQTKSSDNSFSRTLNIPSDTYVYVYSTDESNSSATNYKNVVFQKADNMPSGYYGEWMVFKWDTRKTYSADNVEFFPLMTAAMNGAAAVEMVNELSSFIDTKVDAAYVTNALDARADKFQENESTSVVLNNHTEYRCKVMASLNLSLPETIPDDYNSRIIFESGETATTLSYTAGSIKFTGDDCDSSNAFVPAASTSYEVDIKYLGLDSSGNKRIIARVGSF